MVAYHTLWSNSPILGGFTTVLSGHFQAVDIGRTQPLKLATAEGLCKTQSWAPFVIAAFGNDCETATKVGQIPGAASFLSQRPVSSIDRF